MKTKIKAAFSSSALRSLALAFLAVGGAASSSAAIVLTDGDYSYSQNFGTLPYGFDGAWTDDSTVPGWFYGPTFRPGSNTNKVYQWTQGGNPTPGLQYYTNPAEVPTIRGLGSLTSGSSVNGYDVSQVLYGFQIQNGGSVTITEISLAFNQLQWYGGNAASSDAMQFSYSLDATSLSSGTWTTVSALSLGGFINGDGFITLQTTARSSTIAGLGVAPGQSIWFRWQDNDIDGGDAGAGVSNLTLSAVPEPQIFVLIGIGALVLFGRRRRALSL